MFDPADGFIWYPVFVFSTTVHEAAHAWTAWKLGDGTAERGGQVTLDPTPHIVREPIGMVVVPLITFFIQHWMIGWASAPFNPQWAIRNPRRSALMSFAGPASNLLLLLSAAALIRIGMAFHLFVAPPEINFGQITLGAGGMMSILLAKTLSVFFSLNLLLFAFNLLPLPPLDGSGILFFFVNSSSSEALFRFLRQPGLSLIGLVVAWRCFGPIFHPVHLFAVNLLYPGQSYY